MTYLVLPLGISIVIFFIGALYLIKRRNKVGYIFLFSVSCLYALSIEPIKNALLTPLENSFPFKNNVNGDVIVMLGGGIKRNVIDIRGKGFPSDDALNRMVCTYRLWKQLHIPIIISGGPLLKRRLKESEVVKRVLIDMGVSEKYIIEEGKSKDTYENSYYTKQILEKKGFTSPILVTSPYHMRRAVFSFHKQGILVTPFPCSYKEEGNNYNVLDFLPKVGTLEISSRAIKEYLGLIVYRFY